MTKRISCTSARTQDLVVYGPIPTVRRKRTARRILCLDVPPLWLEQIKLLSFESILHSAFFFFSNWRSCVWRTTVINGKRAVASVLGLGSFCVDVYVFSLVSLQAIRAPISDLCLLATKVTFSQSRSNGQNHPHVPVSILRISEGLSGQISAASTL